MSVSPHEQLDTYPRSLAELQAGRDYGAQHEAEVQLKAAFSPGIVFEARCAIGSVQRNSPGLYDQSVISADTLLSLEAVGVNTHDLFKKSLASDMGEQVASAAIDQDRLDIFSYNKGLSFRLTSTAENVVNQDGRPSEAINIAFRDRLLQSPAHQAVLRANEKLSQGGEGEVPEEMSTEPFDYTKDPLGTLVFFDSVGLTQSSRNNGLVEAISRNGADSKQLLQNVLDADAVSAHGRTVTFQDGATVITWQFQPSSPITKQVELRADGTCVYSVKQVAINAYLERANQSSEAMTLPFIETKTASELVSTLESAGLMFSPELQYEMMNIDEADRYGSVYTQLTRQIAKWIDNPDSFRLSDLFVPHDTEYSGLKLAQREKLIALHEYTNKKDSLDVDAYEDTVRSAYAAVRRGPETCESAEVLFTMIDDLLTVASEPARKHQTDLPATKERVQIRNGACFDVVAYYVGAATDNRGGLQHYQAGDVSMLEKTHGAHTFLTTSALKFNGVRLPKG